MHGIFERSYSVFERSVQFPVIFVCTHEMNGVFCWILWILCAFLCDYVELSTGISFENKFLCSNFKRRTGQRQICWIFFPFLCWDQVRLRWLRVFCRVFFCTWWQEMNLTGWLSETAVFFLLKRNLRTIWEEIWTARRSLSTIWTTIWAIWTTIWAI